MLKQRILTALVLVPLVVAGVLGLGTWALGGVFAIVILLGGWEWAALTGLTRIPMRISYLAVLGLLTLVAAPLIPAGAPWLLGLALAGWLLAAGWVLAYQR
ncbi:MAG: phosphatidate cytidylyltransferase, partial [Gammaproteobacteria bacterium]